VNAEEVQPLSGNAVVEIVRPLEHFTAHENVAFTVAVRVVGVPSGEVEILKNGEVVGIAELNANMWVGGVVQENNSRPVGPYWTLTIPNPQVGMFELTARATVDGTVHTSESAELRVEEVVDETVMFDWDFSDYFAEPGTTQPPSGWAMPFDTIGYIHSAPTPGFESTDDRSLRIERTSSNWATWWLNDSRNPWGISHGRFNVEISFRAEQTDALTNLVQLGPTMGSVHSYWTLLQLDEFGRMNVNLSPAQGEVVRIRDYEAGVWYHARFEMSFIEGERRLCVWIAEGDGEFAHYINQVDVSNRSQLALGQFMSFNFNNANGWRMDFSRNTGTWYISNFRATRNETTLPAITDIGITLRAVSVYFNRPLFNARAIVAYFEGDTLLDVAVSEPLGWAVNYVWFLGFSRPPTADRIRVMLWECMATMRPLDVYTRDLIPLTPMPDL